MSSITASKLGAPHLDILRHALGTGADGHGHPYRNHFVTGEPGVDYTRCMDLVEAGYMARHQGNALSGGDWIFTVTGAGRAAAEPWDPPYIAPGTREANMVVLEAALNGKPTVWCDPEIVDLVRALNAGGVRTVASCSGHGEQHGIITLADGRELAILPDYETARRADPLLGSLVSGGALESGPKGQHRLILALTAMMNLASRKDAEWLHEAIVALSQSAQQAVPVPSQEQLIQWAIGWRGSDSREGLSGEADMIERITYAIRSSMLTEAQPAAPAPVVVTKDMVNRFLGWPLPRDFHPDAGISFKPAYGPDSPWWPTGTNLLHAGQAKAMLEHVLAIARAPDQVVGSQGCTRNCDCVGPCKAGLEGPRDA